MSSRKNGSKKSAAAAAEGQSKLTACVRVCACVTPRLLSCERTPDDTGTTFAYRTAITEPGGILPALNDELVSARDDKVPLAENGAQTRDLRCFDVVPR